MKIVLTGVKASGKTTVVQLVKKLLPEVKVLVVGDYFQRAFKQVYGERAKREMTEEISREEIIELQRRVGEQLVKDSKDAKVVLIDTNLLFIKSTGFFPGLPEEFLRILNPDIIVVMEVHPESILARRLKDEVRIGEEVTEIGTKATSRIRHAGKTVDEIEMEQTIQRIFAVNCASLIGCCVKIINLTFKEKQPYEHAKIAAEEIIKIIEKSSYVK